MKSTSSRNSRPTGASLERRAFMLKAGSALSATLACASAAAAAPATAADPTSRADTDAIRELNERYGEALNEHRYEDIVPLFSDDAHVLGNNRVFVGRTGVRQFYVVHFGAHFAGDSRYRGEPVHALMLAVPGERDVIDIAPDRRSAKARWRRMMQVEAAIVGSGSLVAMARQQGQGVARWWEYGTYDLVYARTGAAWRIQRLAYQASAPCAARRAPLRVPPQNVPLYGMALPDQPAGPERLIS